jgi:hypothetical protein
MLDQEVYGFGTVHTADTTNALHFFSRLQQQQQQQQLPHYHSGAVVAQLGER